jgi:membrane fusion protein (multidrug efflux system)
VTNNTENKSGFLTRHRKVLLLGGPLLVILAVAYFYFTGGRFVSTDDAYIQSARTDISSNIPGRVVSVDVKDNQIVHKGDVLFKLDDSDYKIAVEDAKAKLDSAKLQIIALKATYQQRIASVQEAKDTAAYEQHELERQQKLTKQGISSQADLDKAQHALDAAQKQVDADTQQQQNVLADLGNNPDIDVTAHPAVQQAQAALDRATLNLSYTIVTAAVDGIVTKVDQLQVGSYIKGATPVFALVSDSDIWIEANFKETDLTHMQVGQEAIIEIDTYPGKKFHGKVQSLSPGTGSSFSLLPPENASGNWVKVVQRLPVRLSIENTDKQIQLQGGLSVTATVDTLKTRLQRREF